MRTQHGAGMGSQIDSPVDAVPLPSFEVECWNKWYTISIIEVLIRRGDDCDAPNEVDDVFVEKCCVMGDIESRLVGSLRREIAPLLLVIVILMQQEFGAHLWVDAPCEDDF